MMRILRVVHRLYPPTLGGSSYYAHQLSVAQAKAGDRVVVFTTQEGDYPTHESRDGYEIYRDRALAWPWGNPITVGMLRRLLSRGDDSFDLLDAHSHLMFTTNLAAFRRHLSKNPLVITNHGFRVKRGGTIGISQSIYLSTLGRWTLHAADYVVSLTENDRRKTITAGVPPRKTIVIPNGVDTRLFRPLTPEQIPHSVLWTGRYVPEKGLAHLLKAAKVVAADVPDSKFLLVGSGEEQSKLVALTRQLELENNVRFIDPIPQKDIAALLNKCTLFALPSLSEGFPNALLEAMACAKPVVATCGIGLEEVVGDVGILVPPGKSCELATAIKTILTDPRLGKKLGVRGRERVMTYYDWRKVVSTVNSLYKKAIEEKRA